MAREEAACPAALDADRAPPHPDRSRLAPALVLACLGVVYGDIGTSPLYALRESLAHAHEEGLPETSVIGIVSLLFWTVVLIVTVKYVLLILRADNNGEGGTLSLVAKAQGALKVGPRARRRRLLLLLGIIGVSLFFGDSMITSAISVLSAVEGLTLVQPAFAPWVVPVTLGIVAVLFWAQSGGTDRIARLFGPVMLVWFSTMGILGLGHIADDARILQALNPLRAAGFLTDYGIAAMPVLGSVFLAVTGAEALYADMGHFGRRAIRVAWTVLVFPALALSYLGQGAMVLAHPERAVNPFFLMAPDWFLVPLVLLATAATVIASQAVISGAFSVAAQAVQMGLLPRLRVKYTSDTQVGQIFLPKVNAVLLAGVMALVLAFGSSARLASAYGIAVTGDMVITSMLAVVVFRWAWGWSWPLIAALMVPVLGIELIFLSANLMKLLDGGYIPLLFAGFAIAMMLIWVEGMARLQDKLAEDSISMDRLAAKLSKSPPVIVPGTAVFLTADPMIGPPALLHNLKHNRVLHERNFIVKVESATTPRVPDDARLRLEPIAPGLWRAWLSFGNLEHPNVPRALAEAKRQGLKFDIMSTSFFLNRRTLRSGKGTVMPRWMSRVFVHLYRSSAEPTNHYRLPSNRVVELGQQKNI